MTMTTQEQKRKLYYRKTAFVSHVHRLIARFGKPWIVEVWLNTGSF